MIDLKQNVQYVKGVGPAKVALLNNLGIYTLEDLITYFPREYEDRSKQKNICDVIDGEEITIIGTGFTDGNHAAGSGECAGG